MKKIVLDANAFINNNENFILSLLGDAEKELYTIPQIISKELKDDNAKRNLKYIEHRLRIQVPSYDSVKWISGFAQKSGDISVLSQIDIQILALTLDLEKVAHNGSLTHLRSTPLPPRVSHGEKISLKSPNMPITGDNKFIDDDKSTDDGEGEWITPSFLTSTGKKDHDGLDNDYLVACATSDFAMQNLLIQIGICVISSTSKLRIKSIRHWVLRCHACYAIERNTTRQFCDSCGSPTLLRTSVGISAETGELILYLKKNFNFNNRGTIYSIPEKKKLLLRGDQKEYSRSLKSYHRSIKKSIEDPDSLPSLMASVSLRSSRLKQLETMHPPKIGYGRKNINQVNHHCA